MSKTYSQSLLNVVQSHPELKKLLAPKFTSYIPHTPTPKQAAFLWLTCLDAFYGGAAGGGKSDALLMAALQYVDIPHYSALLLRDSYTNLTMPGALIDRAEEWLGPTDAHWDEKKKTWKFPSGATLTFGYLAGPRDHLNYKSAEFQFIGIDEAGDLRWSQIMYMFSRLRRLEGSAVPVRFRLGSNPGGISHNDIKDRYMSPYLSDKIRKEEGRIFIPAKLDDNPFLDKEVYKRSLNQLDPVSRAQLLEGDWDAIADGMFMRHWFPIVSQIEGKVVNTVRYWDLAATKPKKENEEPAYTVGLRMCRTEDGIFYITSIIRFRESPRYVEQIIRQTADMDGKKVPIWMEQEPGSSGVNTTDTYRRKILPEFIFKGDKVTGSKIERAMPLASQAEAGNVRIVDGVYVKDFLDEIQLFPNGKFKDQVDAASGAFDKLFTPKPEPRASLM